MTALVLLLGLASARVEYTKIEGQDCLQPKLYSDDVELQDFRDAETQWLTDNYPGWKATQSMLVLLLSGDAESQEIDKETFDLALPDLTTRKVCFDIHHKTSKPRDDR